MKKSTQLLVLAGIVIVPIAVLLTLVIWSSSLDEKELQKQQVKEVAWANLSPQEHLKLAKEALAEKNYALMKKNLEVSDQKDPEVIKLTSDYLKRIAENRKRKELEEKKKVQFLLQKLKLEIAERRKHGVNIGMTEQEVLWSNWGRPSNINKSQYADGVLHEQWCYRSGSYLYFDDGILTGIQN